MGYVDQGNINQRGSYRLFERNDESENDSVTSTTSTTNSASSSFTQSTSSSSSTSSALDSNGCVVCSVTPVCPTCNSDEQCAMSIQTCLECPKTYCLKISSDSTSKNLSSAEVGGIAGGLSGFVFILFMVGIYFIYKKYKLHNEADYGLGISEEMKELTGFNGDDDENDFTGDKNLGEGRLNNRRSPYLNSGNNDYKRMSQNSLSTMTNSVLTKASNVLNVAYIPGVTSSRPTRPVIQGNRRSTRRPTTSIYSKGMSVYSKETYFSDLENASFYGGNVATKAGKPVLVDIKHDEYNYDEDYDESDDEVQFPININLQPFNRRDIKDEIVEEEEEEEYEYEEEEEEEKEEEKEEVEEEEEEEEGYDMVQLNIGISNTNHRPFPNRYAALVEKNDKTNQLDPFEPIQIAGQNVIDTEVITGSSSESSSDSDEENIEFLLQNKGNNSNNDNDSNDENNPFSSPIE